MKAETKIDPYCEDCKNTCKQPYAKGKRITHCPKKETKESK